MNASGVLLLLLGSWVLVQIFGGKALERLGIIADTGS